MLEIVYLEDCFRDCNKEPEELIPAVDNTIYGLRNKILALPKKGVYARQFNVVNNAEGVFVSGYIVNKYFCCHYVNDDVINVSLDEKKIRMEEE